MADNRTKEIFEALMARDAVLLNEILENINRSERASGLSADQYGSGEFPVGKPPLVTAVQIACENSYYFSLALLC